MAFVTPYATRIIAQGISNGLFTIGELEATFLAHVNAFTGVDGTPAGAGDAYRAYIDAIFEAFKRGKDKKYIDYILEALRLPWVYGGSPPALP